MRARLAFSGATRGWSYGQPIADPRTGEVVKGAVVLGSLRVRQDIMIFQVLDRSELDPQWDESVLLEDVESGRQVEVSPDYMRTTYKERIQSHLEKVRKAAARSRADHVLLVTDEPLVKALSRYLMFRQRGG